jgi:hypothetical protein
MHKDALMVAYAPVTLVGGSEKMNLCTRAHGACTVHNVPSTKLVDQSRTDVSGLPAAVGL